MFQRATESYSGLRPSACLHQLVSQPASRHRPSCRLVQPASRPAGSDLSLRLGLSHSFGHSLRLRLSLGPGHSLSSSLRLSLSLGLGLGLGPILSLSLSLEPKASGLGPRASSLEPRASGLGPRASGLGPRASASAVCETSELRRERPECSESLIFLRENNVSANPADPGVPRNAPNH
eukprot:gene17759-biopygen10702